MRSKNLSVSDESRAYDHGFYEAFTAVEQARARHVTIRPHRSLTPLKVTPYLFLQAILFPVVLCALMLWIKPLLLEFWRYCIVFWSGELALHFRLSNQLNEANSLSLLWLETGLGGAMPGLADFAVITAATLLVFALSFQMRNKTLPLKSLVRLICGVQIIALIFWLFMPKNFPGSIARHSEELMVMGYVVMFVTPVVLAMGYYILNLSLFSKLGYTALILLFFAVMVPHQVLVHALILQNFSTLLMPLLYIFFGAVFDVVVFIALYSWVASHSPISATN